MWPHYYYLYKSHYVIEMKEKNENESQSMWIVDTKAKYNDFKTYIMCANRWVLFNYKRIWKFKIKSHATSDLSIHLRALMAEWCSSAVVNFISLLANRAVKLTWIES